MITEPMPDVTRTEPTQSTATAASASDQERLLAAFAGNIPPVAVPIHYRVGLFLVAVAMLLLPLVYLALIGLTGWAVGWHLVHSGGIWTDSSVGLLAKLLFYFGPVVIGVLLILFMIKPLFAQSTTEEKPLVLKPAEEPLLFAFIERLCACVGAPLPRAIHVDCQVNASAGLRHGLRSLFGNDLVLTIGLPLAGGLSLRQLAGVLAHEFGHFAQAAGMRMTFIIRSVNAWFARVVYERDGWDESLARACRQVDFRLGIVLYLARFFIWLTRKILWALMHVGHWISCFMLRQMEYDADRYEALLAGSDTFAATARRLPVLAVGSQAAHQNLSEAFNEGRLADDLPGLMLARLHRLKPELLQAVQADAAQRKTKLFDTHPSDADRIASAQQLAAPGLFTPPLDDAGNELPASVLFGDFAATSRAASALYYRQALGEEFKPSLLVPLQEIESRNSQAEASQQALERFWGGQFSTLRPRLVLAQLPAPDPARLQALRQQMADALPAYRTDLKTYDAADTQWLEHLTPRALRLVKSSTQVPLTAQPQATPAMETFEALARERLALALALLQDGASPALANAPALRERLERLLPPTAKLSELVPAVIELRNQYAEIGAHLNVLGQHPKNQDLISGVTSRLPGLAKKLRELCQQTDGLTYPFEHAEGERSLRDFAFPKPLPTEDEFNPLMHATSEALNKLHATYQRGTAALAEIAETLETAHRLPPLPQLKGDSGSLPVL